jgi:hypothetical protein
MDEEYTERAGAFGGMTLDFSGVTATAEEVFGEEDLGPGEMLKRIWAFAKANGLIRKSA